MRQRILDIAKIISEIYWCILKLFNHFWLGPIEHYVEIIEEQTVQ